jgi:predicted dehydrogenase/aryl-alcohol dehydrogenase-like predicted oxidoreductase
MRAAEKLQWGIIGTGGIARAFAHGVKRSHSGALAAVASRARETAEKFARETEIPRAHASYDALLDDPTVQAVYVATPHPLHAEWAIRAADAGKHVLVEKPIGMNHAEAMRIVEAAVANDVFLMEAFMYRCHPQVRRLVELIRDRAIGDVRVIHATFSFHWPKTPDLSSRLLNHTLGGGGILDVGCYCTSIARLIAGAALGNDFADPIDVKAVGHIGAASRVDEWAVASLKFPSGIVAQLACGVQCRQESVVRVDGSEGSLYLPHPFVPAKEPGATKIVVTRHDGSPPREIVLEDVESVYALEADTVARHVEKRQAPEMSWNDSLGNMKALDKWRAQIGLTYDLETPDHFPRATTAPRRLASSRNAQPLPMKFGHVPGVNKSISRLIMGCDNQPNFPHAAAMFDDFFARGGNAFDTAWLYHAGHQERLLGQWVKLRDVREQVVLIVKGGHTPCCNPIDVTTQLIESLERLGTDHADVYLLHRDNPLIPAGEFVDVLDEHARAGRIGAFGGSNWTTARVDAANEYAKRNGRRAFAVLSNQFSLARMVEAPWAGCFSAGDDESRAWLARTQMPLLAWSSQAQGFFATDPVTASPNAVRCWHAEDNFRRLERVRELARKRGVHPTNVALAYVLHQPFPTFALIGPRQLSETRTTWQALGVELSAEEVRWLNFER